MEENPGRREIPEMSPDQTVCSLQAADQRLTQTCHHESIWGGVCGRNHPVPHPAVLSPCTSWKSLLLLGGGLSRELASAQREPPTGHRAMWTAHSNTDVAYWSEAALSRALGTEPGTSDSSRQVK